MKKNPMIIPLILLLCIIFAYRYMGAAAEVETQNKPRARDLGIPFEGTSGPLNAISDVLGVEVGHTTLISGEGKLEVGKGPIRTGVTAILPRGRKYDPVFAVGLP